MYNSDESTRVLVRMFPALAFIPPSDVFIAFSELAEHPDTEKLPDEFVNYFESTYIGRERGRGKNKRITEPMYRIELWKVHDRLQENLPRTNNNIEGWNHGFNTLLGGKNPTIWRLIKALHQSELTTRKRLVYSDIGSCNIQRKKYQTLTLNLKQILKDYNEDDKLKTLKNVAYLLHTF